MFSKRRPLSADRFIRLTGQQRQNKKQTRYARINTHADTRCRQWHRCEGSVLFFCFFSQVLAKSVAVLHSPRGRRKAHYIINEYTAVCGETTKDHSSKILQQAAAQSAVCLQGGRVCAGTGFFFFFSRSSHCVCNNSDLFTTAIPPPRRCRLMKEKIGSGETEVSFRGFPPASLSDGEKLSSSLFANPVVSHINMTPSLAPPVDITLYH